MGPIWDHLKLLYIERIMASSILFFLFQGKSKGIKLACYLDPISNFCFHLSEILHPVLANCYSLNVCDAQYQRYNCDAGNRIAKVMDGRRVHLHANHGVVIATQTIGEAFDYLYYLERAAEVTIKALSTGKPLKLIDEAVCATTREKFVDSGIAAEVRLLVLHSEA